MTLPQALETFLQDQHLRGNTPKTIRGYQSFLQLFINWINEHHPGTTLPSLTLQQVNAYQHHLLTRPAENKPQPLTRRTVRTYMRHIKIFLSFCHTEGYLPSPIHAGVKLPKAEKPVIEILTDHETDRLLAVLKDSPQCHRDRAIICLMLDAGLRRGEAAQLRRKDINFNDRYIVVTGKGQKSRIVPFGHKVYAALQAHLAQTAPAGNTLFTLSPNGIYLMMNRKKKKAGIPRLHPHLLRHTFATNFLIHGLGDIYELSRILGHADIKITEGYLQLANYYKLLQNRNRQSYLDQKETRCPKP